MAATGDEAAVMDSISKVTEAQPAALNPTEAGSSHAETPLDVAEAAALAPKKPNNSK